MVASEITDVFFDLDHTLWDFDKNSQLAFQRVFQNHNIELELDRFISEYEPINSLYWKKYRDEIIGKDELRRGRLIDTFNVFNISMPLQQIDMMAASYIEELPKDNYLLENTFEILDYLFPKYRLHIITNGFEVVQQLKLSNSGIQNYFHTVTTSEDAGIKKPHPFIFESALKKAAVSALSSIMIGDNMEADILGAKSAGMNTLFFNYRNEKVVPPILAVNRLIDIKNYL
jgi:putative hydrolase of the HAD superfamily